MGNFRVTQKGWEKWIKNTLVLSWQCIGVAAALHQRCFNSSLPTELRATNLRINSVYEIL